MVPSGGAGSTGQWSWWSQSAAIDEDGWPGLGGNLPYTLSGTVKSTLAGVGAEAVDGGSWAGLEDIGSGAEADAYPREGPAKETRERGSRERHVHEMHACEIHA
jgi:hypothetical protein